MKAYAKAVIFCPKKLCEISHQLSCLSCIHYRGIEVKDERVIVFCNYESESREKK